MQSLHIPSWFLLLPGEHEGPKQLGQGVQVTLSQEARGKGDKMSLASTCVSRSLKEENYKLMGVSLVS